MSIDRNIVGRVGEDKIRSLGLQEMIVGHGMPGIAAQQPMPIEEPQVTAPGHGRDWIGEGRDLVIRSMLRVGRRLPRLIEQQINLGEREAGDLHTEFEIDKGLQFDREHLAPARLSGH